MTIRLLPRPMPIQWVLSIWHKQKETLTFEADLDCAPGIRLEVLRHRWLTHNDNKVFENRETGRSCRPGPVVLTTCTQWKQELPPVINTLMTSRGHNLLSVRFRPESPHLAATSTSKRSPTSKPPPAFWACSETWPPAPPPPPISIAQRIQPRATQFPPRTFSLTYPQPISYSAIPEIRPSFDRLKSRRGNMEFDGVALFITAFIAVLAPLISRNTPSDCACRWSW